MFLIVSERIHLENSALYSSVKGLGAFVVSRFAEGGAIEINEDMSEMYWG